MADVYLHVGLPKTGTTSIQLALTDHVAELAAAGVLFPGGRHLEQRHAVHDLLGQRTRGDRTRFAGSFDRLVAEMSAFEGATMIVSEEALTRARPRHVRRLVAALEGHRVFVVLTLRDLPRMLISAWQQSVVMGDVLTWPEFLACVRSPANGHASTAAAFWLKHDAGRVLDAWGSVLPPERLVLVTVPPAGAPAGVLFQRFGEAVGVAAGIWAGDLRPRNVGLGAVETEVVRRLNGHLDGALAMMPYRRMIENGIRPEWQEPTAPAARMAGEDLAWARERAVRSVADLERRGHRLVGDLADLVPPAEGEPAPVPAPPTETQLLDATESALAALAAAYGRLSDSHRRLARSRDEPAVSRTTVLRSTARAVVFGLMRRGLGWADRLPPLAWVARRYARPSTGR